MAIPLFICREDAPCLIIAMAPRFYLTGYALVYTTGVRPTFAWRTPIQYHISHFLLHYFISGTTYAQDIYAPNRQLDASSTHLYIITTGTHTLHSI